MLTVLFFIVTFPLAALIGLLVVAGFLNALFS